MKEIRECQISDWQYTMKEAYGKAKNRKEGQLLMDVHYGNWMKLWAEEGGEHKL